MSDEQAERIEHALDSTSASRPSGTRSNTHILTVLGLGTALSLLGDSTLYTVLPDPMHAATAGVTLTAVGFILGANRLTRMATNPLAGALLDRLPRRTILLPAMFIGLICTLIYALGSGLLTFIIGRVLWGFAWSGIWIGGNSVILDITQTDNRGKLSGIYQTWFFIGVGSSALLAGIFTDSFGFRGGLGVSAALNTLALILWFFLLPETRAPASSRSAVHSKLNHRFNWAAVMFAALPTFGIRFVYAGALASTSILWLASLFDSGLSLGMIALPIATLTGLFVALRTVTSMFSGPIAGGLSDRLGKRWGVTAGLLLIGALGTWLMGHRTVAVAILGGFIAAVPSGGVQALVPALIGDQIHAEHEGRALGVIYTVGDLGSALGPVAALGLIEPLGLPAIYRGCSMLLMALGAISILRLRHETSTSTSEAAQGES